MDYEGSSEEESTTTKVSSEAMANAFHTTAEIPPRPPLVPTIVTASTSVERFTASPISSKPVLIAKNITITASSVPETTTSAITTGAVNSTEKPTVAGTTTNRINADALMSRNFTLPVAAETSTIAAVFITSTRKPTETNRTMETTSSSTTVKPIITSYTDSRLTGVANIETNKTNNVTKVKNISETSTAASLVVNFSGKPVEANKTTNGTDEITLPINATTSTTVKPIIVETMTNTTHTSNVTSSMPVTTEASATVAATIVNSTGKSTGIETNKSTIDVMETIDSFHNNTTASITTVKPITEETITNSTISIRRSNVTSSSMPITTEPTTAAVVNSTGKPIENKMIIREMEKTTSPISTTSATTKSPIVEMLTNTNSTINIISLLPVTTEAANIVNFTENPTGIKTNKSTTAGESVETTILFHANMTATTAKPLIDEIITNTTTIRVSNVLTTTEASILASVANSTGKPMESNKTMLAGAMETTSSPISNVSAAASTTMKSLVITAVDAIKPNDKPVVVLQANKTFVEATNIPLVQDINATTTISVDNFTEKSITVQTTKKITSGVAEISTSIPIIHEFPPNIAAANSTTEIANNKTTDETTLPVRRPYRTRTTEEPSSFSSMSQSTLSPVTGTFQPIIPTR